MNQVKEVADRVGRWALATPVPEGKRNACLPKHFGMHCVRVEQAVFRWMDRLAPAYSGGQWDFYELFNGGFYMAPQDGPYRLSCEGNGFEGEVSADGAGVVACLMSYSHLSFQIEDPCFANAFRRLLACVHRHPEAATILRAID